MPVLIILKFNSVLKVLKSCSITNNLWHPRSARTCVVDWFTYWLKLWVGVYDRVERVGSEGRGGAGNFLTAGWKMEWFPLTAAPRWSESQWNTSNVFNLLFFLQGLIQGPGEFAQGLAIGARSLFGHTVGTLIWMYIQFLLFLPHSYLLTFARLCSNKLHKGHRIMCAQHLSFYIKK